MVAVGILTWFLDVERLPKSFAVEQSADFGLRVEWTLDKF